MTVTHKPVTAKELLWTPDEGFRRELVCGEVRRMAPAGNVHGRLAVNVSTPLDRHVRDQDLGIVYAAETEFKIGATLTRQGHRMLRLSGANRLRLSGTSKATGLARPTSPWRWSRRATPTPRSGRRSLAGLKRARAWS